jgi:hypothetical protein
VASWITFATAWIVYISEVQIFYTVLPVPVKVIIVALPIFFSLFGVTATVAYAITPGPFKTLDNAFDILSLSVKIMVVVCLWVSTAVDRDT